ncbi:hypothetical protein [Streptomyces sp. NPDC088923]|uniref:hypothetical protein n=1 Tax=Streptomyces sp. NPDC088923 TaxID=3365913 RepID=UPI0038029B45
MRAARRTRGLLRRGERDPYGTRGRYGVRGGLLAGGLALALTATGCVTVHGETALVPAATRGEAATALKRFRSAYNEAARDLAPAKDAAVLAGPFGAITQDTLRSRKAQNPAGGAKASPLEVSDVRYLIPRQRGWPRWFVADTDTDRDVDDDPARDTRWLFLFTRSGPEADWRATYLAILAPGEIPKFRTDGDGYVVPATPGALSRAYTTYLRDGRGARFAPGQHTTGWREQRARNAERPGWTIQWADEPADTGAFRPYALRTADGGSLAFFASRHYERRTGAANVTVTPPLAAKPLLKGRVDRSYTLEYTSNETVKVPKAGKPVVFLNRLQGLTGAEGS